MADNQDMLESVLHPTVYSGFYKIDYMLEHSFIICQDIGDSFMNIFLYFLAGLLFLQIIYFH